MIAEFYGRSKFQPITDSRPEVHGCQVKLMDARHHDTTENEPASTDQLRRLQIFIPYEV
jgi:hypothetical protein